MLFLLIMHTFRYVCESLIWLFEMQKAFDPISNSLQQLQFILNNSNIADLLILFI